MTVIQGNVFLSFIFPRLKGINIYPAVTGFVIVLNIHIGRLQQYGKTQ